MPIPDKIAAAKQINEFLKAVVANAGLRLKYRISVDPPLAEDRDWERPEILVELAGPALGRGPRIHRPRLARPRALRHIPLRTAGHGHAHLRLAPLRGICSVCKRRNPYPHLRPDTL